MKIIEIEPKKVDFKTFKMRSALEDDCKRLVDYNCLVQVNGSPVILYRIR